MEVPPIPQDLLQTLAALYRTRDGITTLCRRSNQPSAVDDLDAIVRWTTLWNAWRHGGEVDLPALVREASAEHPENPVLRAWLARQVARPLEARASATQGKDLYGRVQARDDLLKALREDHRPVELVGTRRMGKTTLLRWVAQHGPPGVPVAWVDAKGIAGRSPLDLVTQIAGKLGRLPNSGQLGSSPERALTSLMPAFVVVDEAHDLAKRDRGFDQGFLDICRALSEEELDRRLYWASASRERLLPLFHRSGLTSAFLNDSAPVWVGQLEDGAARALVAHIDPASAELAIQEAGGFAHGLKELCKLIAVGMSAEHVRAGYRVNVRPVFELWWDELSPEQRELLRLLASSPVPIAAAEPSVLHELVNRGLVAGSGLLPGAAWRRFVLDAP